MYTKVIKTPIYNINEVCFQHHIVLLQKTPFYNNQREYKDIFAIDFSPIDDITDWKYVIKLLLGKSVDGKIRLAFFHNVDHDMLLSDSINNKTLYPIKMIDDIDKNLYKKITNWDPNFQLYTHNCQHFGRYLIT